LPQHVSADTNAAMNDKPKKPQKLRARLPRGLEDRGPAAIAATRQMVEKIRAVYERYGFEPVETPAFEYTDALGKFLPDQDRPNEGVFSFQDDDEQWISLRYDRCQSPIAATAPAMSIATRNPAPAASASSCSSTPTRLGQARRPLTPRCA
jgi:histidyl-tRNA synthetase